MARTKRVPSEIDWWRGKGHNISHLNLINFFKSYNTRRPQARFLDAVKFVEEFNRRLQHMASN